VREDGRREEKHLYRCTGLTAVVGDLELSRCTALTVLPDGLSVDGEKH